MWKIFISLIFGIFIGCKFSLPEKLCRLNNYLTWLGLVILLFFMGLMLGANEEILKQVNILGFKAFSLAAGSVLGSIIIVRILDKTVFKWHGRSQQGESK